MTTHPIHGTTTLTTPRLTLRRHTLSDAPTLHRDFGLDPEMSRYSGWNPYATPEMAEETALAENPLFSDLYMEHMFFPEQE